MKQLVSIVKMGGWVILFVLCLGIPREQALALTESWAKIYTTTPTNSIGVPYGVSLDQTGNYIYVGGRFYESGIVIKYDTLNGATSTGWPVSFRHPSTTTIGYINNAGSISVDTGGNVYVSGDFSWHEWQNRSLGIIKYGPGGGSPLWTKLDQLRSGQNTYGATNSKNALNPFQTVLYVGGADALGTNFVNRYSASDGTYISEYIDTGVDYSTPPSTFRVTTDKQGNIYSLGGSPSLVLRRRNSAGSVIWTRSFATSNMGGGLVVDPADNYIYLLAGDAFGLQMITKVASSSGNLVAPWPISQPNFESQDLTVTPNNRLYVFGRTNCSGIPPVCYLGIGVYNASSSGLIEHYVSGRQAQISFLGTSDANNNVYAVSSIPTGSSSAAYLTIKYGASCTGPSSFNWTNTITASSSLIRPTDLNEMRTAIDTLRTDAGLSAYSWTDSVATINTPPRATQINDLRTALEAVYTACGQTLPSWTDGSRVTAGTTPVRAQHITELRAAISAAR